MGIISILVVVEDIRMDDIIWGVNREEREVDWRENIGSINIEGMSNSGGIFRRFG